MPINPALLIAAPMLQDAIIDKTTGLPLYNGKIILWQDNARTILKNWYYQTGTPGSYNYLPLPNPLTLSSAGSIVDINGVDTIPFFYPYNEVDNVTAQPYFIQVYDQFGQLQFTRQNFPYNPSSTPSTITEPTNYNLITNSEFWRNIGSINVTNISTNPGFGQIGAVVAPSQHDNFAFPDMQFIKNANGATDIITFDNFVSTFDDQIVPNQITPQYYMNFTCTSAGTETKKYLQIPLQSQVTSLSGYQNTCFTIAARSSSTGTNAQISIAMYQYLGTGVSSTPPSISDTINLTNNWEKYVVNGIPIPSADGLTLGNGGDDGLYIQIYFPAGVGSTCNIDIAFPAFYLNKTPPTNDWQTYDAINSIISSPRTGDIRTSYNNYTFGYVQMNDGTIGSNSSNSTARAKSDTFPLYNLIWYMCTSNQILAPMYSSTYQPVSYGANPITDFNANNQLSLTKQLGRYLLEGIPTSMSATVTSVDTGTSTLTLSASAWATYFNNNVPVTISSTGTVPGGLTAGLQYFVSINTSNNLLVQLLNSPNGSVVSITTNGTGTITLSLYGSGNIANFIGEYNHSQTINELASHNHSLPGTAFAGNNLGSFSFNPTGGFVGFTANTTNTGGGNPSNVISPGTFSNFYIKL